MNRKLLAIKINFRDNTDQERGTLSHSTSAEKIPISASTKNHRAVCVGM